MKKNFKLFIIGLSFSDAVSPHMKRISKFHNNMNKFLLFIIILVIGGLFITFYSNSINLKLLEYISVEIV
jgi:hypothetical protein